jgi:hypothetical protein
MKCLPSEIVKGLSSPRPPEPRKLLLVQFTFEPVHDDVVDASGIEELQELLAACFHRDQYGTVVLKSPLLMGSLGEDMVLGDRETMPILFDESRVGVLPLGSERMCADGIELGSRDFGPDGLFGQTITNKVEVQDQLGLWVVAVCSRSGLG